MHVGINDSENNNSVQNSYKQQPIDMNKIILHFLYGMNCGGLERRVCRTLLALHQFHPELELHLAVAYGEVFYPELTEHDSGVTVHLLHGRGNRDVLGKLYSLLKDLKPDVLQCWTIKEAAMGGMLKPFFHYRLIASYVANVFGKPHNLHRFLYWFTEKMADCVVSNSQAGLIAYEVPEKSGVVIQNCYEFHPVLQKDVEKVRKELELEGKQVILSVANIQQHKDYETFLAVAIDVTRQNKNVVFLAVGGGAALDQYRAKVPVELQKNIIFTGARKDVETIVECADIGLLCTFTEGISNTILEYMAHGKAAVASGSGGLSETIRHGKTGYLFPTGDVTAVTNALKELLADRNKAESMGQCGKKIVQTEYTMEKSADAYMNLYQGKCVR